MDDKKMTLKKYEDLSKKDAGWALALSIIGVLAWIVSPFGIIWMQSMALILSSRAMYSKDTGTKYVCRASQVISYISLIIFAIIFIISMANLALESK